MMIFCAFLGSAFLYFSFLEHFTQRLQLYHFNKYRVFPQWFDTNSSSKLHLHASGSQQFPIFDKRRANFQLLSYVVWKIQRCFHHRASFSACCDVTRYSWRRKCLLFISCLQSSVFHPSCFIPRVLRHFLSSSFPFDSASALLMTCPITINGRCTVSSFFVLTLFRPSLPSGICNQRPETILTAWRSFPLTLVENGSSSKDENKPAALQLASVEWSGTPIRFTQYRCKVNNFVSTDCVYVR